MKYLAVLFIVLFIVSCAEGYTPPNSVPVKTVSGDSSVTDDLSSCTDLVYYPIEYSTEGAYVSERGEVYRVTMHFENVEDAAQVGAYTAKDLGMAANSVFEAWQDQALPNPEIVRDYLSVFHVIVLHTKEMTDLDFARLYEPEAFLTTPGEVLKKVEKIGAYVYWAGNKCFPDVPEDAHFVIIFRHYDLLLEHIWTIIHELLHPSCAAGLNDAQGNHDNERIWDGLGYEYNVQRVAVGIFTLDYLQSVLDI